MLLTVKMNILSWNNFLTLICGGHLVKKWHHSRKRHALGTPSMSSLTSSHEFWNTVKMWIYYIKNYVLNTSEENFRCFCIMQCLALSYTECINFNVVSYLLVTYNMEPCVQCHQLYPVVQQIFHIFRGNFPNIRMLGIYYYTRTHLHMRLQ